MSGTRRGSLSIQISELPTGVRSEPSGSSWAQVELEDFFWIGRCWICNLVADDQTVSRLHATIERYGDAYRITDMQSQNGTQVNGQDVRSCLLRPGDVVKIGQTIMRFSPERTQDPTLHEGSTVNTGGGSMTSRSFPCSISMVANETPPPLPPPAVPAAAAQPPRTRTGVPELDAVAAAEAELPGEDAPLLRDHVVGRPPELVTFLTILADRVAAEVKPHAVRVFVPSVRGQPEVSLVRGWENGALKVEEPAVAIVRRIADAIADQPVNAEGEVQELGDLMFWQDGQPWRRTSTQGFERYHLPIGVDGPWGFTIPLVRVGRSTREARDAFRGFAFIHMELGPGEAMSVVDRVLEVAGGLCAATARFVDRAADAEGRV